MAQASFSIHVPLEEAAWLQKEAAKEGLTPHAWIRRLIDQRYEVAQKANELHPLKV